MLTKRGYYKILDNIFKTGGLSEAMEADLEKLKADYDEREMMLKKYGEVYDGEDKDEYEYREFESNTKDWKAEYDALAERYSKRFFTPESEKITETISEVDTPAENTENNVNIDTLLY